MNCMNCRHLKVYPQTDCDPAEMICLLCGEETSNEGCENFDDRTDFEIWLYEQIEKSINGKRNQGQLN